MKPHNGGKVRYVFHLVLCVLGSWKIDKDQLLEFIFRVFLTTSRLVSTSIALHAPLILKNVHFYLKKYCAVGSWEIEKYLLLALIFNVFIITSRLVSTSIALHAPLTLKKCPFLLEKILCSWLLGNRERPIISTCFQCFYHNFTSKIDINSFVCTINIEKMSIFT